jgi:hypothetical protein
MRSDRFVSMHKNLQQFDQRWQLPTVSANSPVFIMAAGWRSGSTLIQRLICSSREVIVWGEPYARCELVQNLSESAKALNGSYPHPGHLPDLKTLGPIEDQWIANLFPPPGDLRHGFRAALDAVLARPAFREGYARFGLKEVRLNADHGRFLQWIYPDARFLAIIRNPWDAWRSAKGLDLYLKWPSQPITDAAIFARHWLNLVESFASWKDKSVFFFRYEDLIENPESIQLIAGHCGLEKVDSSVMNKVIGSFGDKAPLPDEDIAVIESIAGEAARMMGYTPMALRRAA